MERLFQLSCESTVDMAYSYISGRDISVIFYTYIMDGKEYVDNMERDGAALEEFYRLLEDGKLPQTSQINETRYEEYFEELLKNGDVLHVTLGTGMTPSYKNAVAAAENLREKYPDRRLVVVDSLCSSTGYGLLVDNAADLADAGKTVDEVEAYLLKNRNKVHHQFFCADLKQLKRSGRVSGPAAIFANLLGICPLMHLNGEGRIIAYEKVQGKKRVIKKTVDAVLERAEGGQDYEGKLYICHSNCEDLAIAVKEELCSRFDKEVNLKLGRIGTIIASHCGPSTVAIFFMGDERGLK